MGMGLIPEEHRRLVAEALSALDVRNLVLGIHDSSFPSEPIEDTGRGSPYTRGATRFLGFIRELGFTGIQLGPQGQTSESNASPYDSTLFSRNVLNVPLAALVSEEGGQLLTAERLASIVDTRPLGTGPGERYRHAFRAQRAALEEAWSHFQRERTRAEARPALRELAQRFEAFKQEHTGWLLRDALFEALCLEHGQRDWRRWAGQGASALDARLFAPRPGEEQACEARLSSAEARGTSVSSTSGSGLLAARSRVLPSKVAAAPNVRRTVVVSSPRGRVTSAVTARKPSACAKA